MLPRELIYNKSGKVGYIAFFDLEDWWVKTFTEEERRHITEIYQPLGAEKDSLINAHFTATTETAFPFLYTLAGWFNKPNDRTIAMRIITKAEEYASSETNILNLHFFYATKMKMFYKERENPSALEEAIRCCMKQIELAPLAAKAFREEFGDHDLPVHEGYDQLCIIYEKQGKFQDVIRIAEQAKQQGWNGDYVGHWDDRIERCKQKLNALSKN